MLPVNRSGIFSYPAHPSDPTLPQSQHTAGEPETSLLPPRLIVDNEILNTGRLISAHSGEEKAILQHIFNPNTEKTLIARVSGENNLISFEVNYDSFYAPHPVALDVVCSLDKPSVLAPVSLNDCPGILSVSVTELGIPNLSSHNISMIAIFDTIRPLSSFQQSDISGPAKQSLFPPSEQSSTSVPLSSQWSDESNPVFTQTQPPANKTTINGPVRTQKSMYASRTEPYSSASSLVKTRKAIQKSAPEKSKYASLQYEEHRYLMSHLPLKCTSIQEAKIHQFLSYLEINKRKWSELKPKDQEDKRPEKLEDTVITGIREKQLNNNTRDTLNECFELDLRSEMNKGLELPEHRQLLHLLSKKISALQCSKVSIFFGLLEKSGRKWSQLDPKNNDSNSYEKIEEFITEVVGDKKINNSIRQVLNKGFDLQIKPPSRFGVNPKLPEHLKMIETLPAKMTSGYPTLINNFLLYLESDNRTISSLIGSDNDNKCPELLQDAINAGIKEKKLSSGTRAAINEGLDFQIKRSNRFQIKPALLEHQKIMENLPKSTKRNNPTFINKFLCYLEKENTKLSSLTNKDENDKRPALLENMLNKGIKDDEIHIKTVAAMNQLLDVRMVAKKPQVSKNA